MKSNKDIVLYFADKLWNQHDLSVIDELLSENASIHSPMSTVHGKETMHDIVEKWTVAFPDLTLHWDEFISEDDKVVSRFSADATHLGGFFDTKPTYQEVHFTGVIIYRLKQGKIVDYW